MQCSFCQVWNEQDDHRCQRCGRRLEDRSLRSVPAPYRSALEFPNSGAAARAVELRPEETRDVVAEAQREIRAAQQRAIFDEQPTLFPYAPKIVPIPTLTPVRAEGPTPKKAKTTAPKGAGSRGGAKTGQNQQSLDFEIPDTPPRGHRTSVEAVIFCDAPVALPTHRILATAIDTSMVLCAVGVFAVLFWIAGGELALNKQTVPLLAAIVLLFAFLYKALYCLGNGDTPGMRAAQLRLVDFDGRTPTRSMRALRMGMGIISLCAAGLGLLWALVDEENLTWHDHATKTFPTLDLRR